MKSLSEIIDAYKAKYQYFIGQIVHNSIAVDKNGGVWTEIWISILDSYNNVSNKREFYLNLSYTLLTMLSSNSRFTQLIDTIYNESFNFNKEQLKKQFILNKAIQQEEIELLTEFLCFVYCAAFKTQEIQKELYSSIRSYCTLAEEQIIHEKDKAYAKIISEKFVDKDDEFIKKFNQIVPSDHVVSTPIQKSIQETLFDVIFRHPRVASVLDKNLQFREWPNVGPIFWLWFHLTAGMFVKNKFDENCQRLKEFFQILDYYICSVCAHNFKQKKIAFKNDEYLQKLPVDVFIIEVHSMVRVSQMKNLSNFQLLDQYYMDNLSYKRIVEKFTQEYQDWWNF
jgi:hypothetical protein